MATAKFDMTYNISAFGDRYAVGLEFCTAIFNKDTAVRLLNNFVEVIKNVTADCSKKIGDVEMLTAEDKELVLDKFNRTETNYPKNKTAAELFDEQAVKNSDKIAVSFEGSSLTYSQLNARANSLAHILREMGVGADDFVAVLADRSMEIVEGILGIVKAGGAYVPVDPTYPQVRISFILNDCRPKAVLKYTTENVEIPESIPVINLADEYIWQGNGSNLDYVNSPNDLIYCIYTSGTTGQPKGSLIEQKSVVRLVKNTNYADLDEHTVILQTGSMSFDASTLEVWGAFLNGGKLVVTVQDVITDHIRMRELMEREKVNTMWLTSTLFNQMITEQNDMFDNLEHLLIGGEKLSDDHVRIMKSRNNGVTLTNGYGPTENTTFTTTYDIPAGFENIPIGKPIANTQVYIMNKYLCGVGVPGELCVTGDGVARGYLNRLELTAEKFVDNPFGEGKMYRSGDLARWLPDGNIEYLGRIDEQVKIRGFRIELGEIESRIREIENIKDCAVVAKADSTGDKAIYAYYTSNAEVSISEIKDRLKEVLPNYMIPAYMMQIDFIPITKNGKLDRRALPEIEAKASNEYIAPRNKTEKIICDIFAEVLNAEKVGINDGFFELGGHSLRATRLVNAVEEQTGVKIALKEVFLNSTPEQLAELVYSNEGEKYESIPKAEIKEYYPMSSTQKRTYL
ncbi:MAG: amino acid adenylation domain-containing protein, partial [Clostridia bacterium]|nr:amino acid adenylation domain-containing protein [Clostridia bacterium]